MGELVGVSRHDGLTMMPLSTFAHRGQLLSVLLTACCLAACGRRDGLNFDCQWVPDPAFRVDARDEAQVRHLLDDMRTAEELAIRYGDRLAGWRLVETLGIVTRHGGVKDRGRGHVAREECSAKLFGAIGAIHGVTASDIDSLAPRLRQRGFDPVVTGPLVVLLLFAIRRFTRWLSNRFHDGEWAAWALATVFASLFIPALVLSIGAGWAALVEIVRVGNEHVAHRRPESLGANVLVMLSIGIVAVWLASALSAFRRRQVGT